MANKTVRFYSGDLIGETSLTGELINPSTGAIGNGAGDDVTEVSNGVFTFVVTEAITGRWIVVIKKIGVIQLSGGNVNLRQDIETTYDVDDPSETYGTGIGPRTVTITVDDGTTNITGATVTATRGGVTYSGTTVSGVVTFYLTDGDWAITVGCEGYSSSGGTLTVDGTEAQTYSLSPVSISASSPGRTTGYWTCFDEDGNPEEGASVSIAVAETASTVSGNSYDSKTRTELSAANGVVQFTNMHKGVTYRIQRGTTGPTYLVTVPLTAGGSVALDSFIGLDDA